jgi:CRISPR-associated exonuclease Cas4
MQITGTHFNYYNVCKRKLWLFVKEIAMEHLSDLVYEGKLIHEESYPQRSQKYVELELDGIKIDFYDTRNKIIHEIKKSDKMEPAHEWQVKYYIYILERNGITGVTGLLEYPVLHKTQNIELTDKDRKEIKKIEEDIEKISSLDVCPPRINSRICKKCSYYDFCYSGEV